MLNGVFIISYSSKQLQQLVGLK